ncbi:Maleate isomerase [Roseovarius litorisediminis]|uniref:Maleate isomerase n=1 Tax=Roseovarius litorisediminis TaxID=1312363 RepID=A0A1Y5SQ41_9RHOB|nr:hypothetical protein [Roseovarius litorisediminis]SLN45381.1 Maleate isomerase [Roseovarius litorisediminis]
MTSPTRGRARICFASPYVPGLNDLAIAYLADEGITTVSRADVSGTLDNVGQGAVTPDAVFDLGKRADSPQAQAVLLSCTDMRSVEVIEWLEQALGKPVVTPNQALMFQAFQFLKISPTVTSLGQLFERLPR